MAAAPGPVPLPPPESAVSVRAPPLEAEWLRHTRCACREVRRLAMKCGCKVYAGDAWTLERLHAEFALDGVRKFHAAALGVGADPFVLLCPAENACQVCQIRHRGIERREEEAEAPAPALPRCAVCGALRNARGDCVQPDDDELCSLLDDVRL